MRLCLLANLKNYYFGFITNLCYKNSACTAEAKIELSHHAQKEDGTWENNKTLVFCMDDLKPPPANKKAKTGKGKKDQQAITAKNFGAYLSVPKVKSSTATLTLAWRCRPLGLKCFVCVSLGQTQIATLE